MVGSMTAYHLWHRRQHDRHVWLRGYLRPVLDNAPIMFQMPNSFAKKSSTQFQIRSKQPQIQPKLGQIPTTEIYSTTAFDAAKNIVCLTIPVGGATFDVDSANPAGDCALINALDGYTCDAGGDKVTVTVTDIPIQEAKDKVLALLNVLGDQDINNSLTPSESTRKHIDSPN